MQSILVMNISIYLIAVSQALSLHRLLNDQSESPASSPTNYRSTASGSGTNAETESSYLSQLHSLDITRRRGQDNTSSSKVRRSLTDIQQNQLLSFIDFPPRVGVLLRQGETRILLQVALAPVMSTYDALNQARINYSLINPNSMFNPYVLQLRFNPNKQCAEITTAAAEEAIWAVKVKNRDNYVIHEDTCIPKRANVIMRPGYNIEVYRL